MPQRKLLVLLKERILLLNSQILEEITGEYPWLVDFLEQNPSAKTTDLHNFDEEVQNFFSHRYNAIVTQAASEWVSHNGKPVDIREKDEMFECELCHHKPIIYVCCIVNKLNDKELNVGTECVKHFGMNLGKDVRLLFKDMKKIRRVNSLERAIPGIDKTIFEWERELDGFPLLMPLSYEKPWLELGEKAKKLYMDFLEEDSNQSRDQEFFDELNDVLAKRKSMLDEMSEYVENNKDDKYIPGKEIITWVKREAKSRDVDLLAWLKEDGKIRWRTAFRIGEPKYLKSLIPSFNENIKSIGCTIDRLGEHKGSTGYVIAIKKEQLTVFTRCRDFILDFGGLLFDEKVEKPLDIKNIIISGMVYGENSANLIIGRLEKHLSRFGYGIYKQEHEYNELLFHQKSTGLYVIENLEGFVEKFKLLAVGLDGGNINELESHLSTIDSRKKYSKEDIDYLIGQRR